MIYDKIENMETYSDLPERIVKGLRFLRDTDFSSLSEGRYELEGDALFASVSDYETRVNDKPEAHRKYIDIQFVPEGEEIIGVAGLSDMEEELEANPESDIWFYKGETSNLKLGNGYFIVLFPQDAHAPCRMISEPRKVRKVVVKVML